MSLKFAKHCTQERIDEHLKIAANYFASKYYVQAAQQSCLLHDRQAERLIALPDHFLLALGETVRAETGKASALALYTCASFWAEGFYRREILEHLKGR